MNDFNDQNLKEYYKALNQIHAFFKPGLYLEIGVRNGESFQSACGRTRCIGIDPNAEIIFPFQYNSSFYKMTSDEFFKTEKLSQKVDLAFIDGMHLFENTLRDFINIEKISKTSSIIILHDTMPADMTTSSRRRTTDFWTGDVWKIVPILKRYRPDLHLVNLDIQPSGLALVSNLNPKSTVLLDHYNEILQEYMKQEFSSELDLGLTRTEEFDFSKLQQKQTFFERVLKSKKNKYLGVLLCYNDGDILEEQILYLSQNAHDIIVWDHGSTDETSRVLDKYEHLFIERKYVPRSFDFYNLYETMSRHLINHYTHDYQWISWPDQDEFLEGPDRNKTYREYISMVLDSEYDWVQFRNYNFWYTSADNQYVQGVRERVKYYSLFPDCPPRIRAWRASATNIREFNHNSLDGQKYPQQFNLCHYPMRSKEQLERRLRHDRVDIQRGGFNFHYNNMKKKEFLALLPEQLHYDDGGELCQEVKFNWRDIYDNK